MSCTTIFLCRAVKFSSHFMSKAMEMRRKATILYATETGKSEKFARTLNEIFLYGFDSKVVCMEDYDMDNLLREECVLVVTSTFGNGEAPDNGRVRDLFIFTSNILYWINSDKIFRKTSDILFLLK